MAYSTTDPLNCLTTASLAVGPRIWFHASADSAGAAAVDNFITDGVLKGLKPGDYLLHIDLGTNITTGHLVAASTVAPKTGVHLGTGVVFA